MLLWMTGCLLCVVVDDVYLMFVYNEKENKCEKFVRRTNLGFHFKYHFLSFSIKFTF